MAGGGAPGGGHAGKGSHAFVCRRLVRYFPLVCWSDAAHPALHYNKKASKACDRTETTLSAHLQVHKCKYINVNAEHLMPRSYLNFVVVHSTSHSGSNEAKGEMLG